MPRKRPRVKIRMGRAALLSVLLASFIIMGAGIGFVVGAVRSMPSYDLEYITGDLSSFVFDKDNRPVTTLKSDKNRVQLNQNEIPKVMKDAIIAIEDQRFYKHHGVDVIRIGGAVIANFSEGYGAQGGSTLTQQLVKLAVLENTEKKLRRKIQEAIIALRLESMKSKEEILALYLNNVYYGHGAWSIQTAAQTYFGKDAKNLQLEEAAMLAGVVNAPGRFSPYLNMERAKQRQAIVLNEMVKVNYISKEQAEQAKAKPLKLAGLKQNTYQYQSFLDHVINEAATALKMEGSDVGALYKAGFKIYTTMDSKTQEAAEALYSDDKNFPAGKKDSIIQSAMVVLDPHTGEIRTLIGGRNVQGERQFNRSVEAYRQPGSAFKPVAVYGPALEKGFSPATVLDDYPEEYQTPMGPKSFVNYDARYRGLISMRTAIQYSVNTAAIKMLERVGISEGFNFAKKLGITTLVESGKSNDMTLSMGLGGLTKGVSPLELTAAYGAFANQGIYIKPHAIRKIEDKDGNVLYQHKVQRSVVMTPETAYLMTDMLQTVVQSGTGTKAQMGNRPVAGKTGTTSFNVDAWFVGYTPELVGTVWLGYDKVENMTNVFGGTVGGPIWKSIMTVAHTGLPVNPFPQPEGIATIPTDYKSGLLPSELTPPEFVVMEKFNSAYVPVETSNVWTQLPVCAETGQLLTTYCPSPVTRVFLKRAIPWSGETPPEDAKLEPPTQYCSLHGGSASQGQSGLRLQGFPVVDNNEALKAVKLTWYDPTPAPGTVFQIYRSSQPGVPVTQASKIAEISGGQTSWQDNNITSAGEYYYLLVTQGGGQAQTSNEVFVQAPKTTQQLKQPRLSGQVLLEGNAASVSLIWTKAAENRPIIYYVFRSETPNFEPSSQNQQAVEQTITETAWIDTTVARKKIYYYKIIAFDMDTNQQSPISNQLTVQTN